MSLVLRQPFVEGSHKIMPFTELMHSPTNAILELSGTTVALLCEENGRRMASLSRANGQSMTADASPMPAIVQYVLIMRKPLTERLTSDTQLFRGKTWQL